MCLACHICYDRFLGGLRLYININLSTKCYTYRAFWIQSFCFVKSVIESVHCFGRRLHTVRNICLFVFLTNFKLQSTFEDTSDIERLYGTLVLYKEVRMLCYRILCLLSISIAKLSKAIVGRSVLKDTG